MGAAVSPTVSVQLFTRTAGYRHDSIPAAAAAVAAMPGLGVTCFDDPEQLLRAPCAVVSFLSCTGDVLDEGARRRLRAHVEGGGGFVGLHAAVAAEPSWPWYGTLLGARFAGHPDGLQTATMWRHDRPGDESARCWRIEDEWYAFTELAADNTIRLSVDESSYVPGPYRVPAPHPVSWTRSVGRGRVWYTALGHSDRIWRDPTMLEHVRDGIRWAARAMPIPGRGAPSPGQGG